MNLFRTKKWRLLYLLALAQLVGGPLVLLQVTVFCKMTLTEAPHLGLMRAAVATLNSDNFHGALAAEEWAADDANKSVMPTGEPKQKLEKAKLPMIPWNAAPIVLAKLSVHCKIVDRARTWTPAWTQAPPAPPPRVG